MNNATPTTACVNMTVGALNGPIGSHGAISWARLCHTHGDGGISHWRQDGAVTAHFGCSVAGCGMWLSRTPSTLMQKCSLLPTALPCDVAGMARSDSNTGIAQLILSDLALIYFGRVLILSTCSLPFNCHMKE